MNTNPSTPGTVISFYSYKGGTGRTMAVANAACLLARESAAKSQKVLIVDWDLEAPGLHKFFEKTEQLEKQNRPGIINYFKSLKDLLSADRDLRKRLANKDGWRVLSEVLPVDDYIISEVAAGVDLIPAGRFDPEYPTDVGTFSWVDFYAKFESAITAFRQLLTSRYSYCLIDSRTGLSDTSGICTFLLPEKLVTVFTPNTQSQSGIIDLIKEAVHYRRASDDYRPLSVFPLPSRIDLAEIDLKNKWRDNYQLAFENCFREAYEIEECDLNAYFDEIQLPHVSYYAFGENIAVLREKRREMFSLSRAYQVFIQRLLHLTHSWESIESLTLHQLRAPVGDFVGREHETETLINALRRGNRASVTAVSGMGGIGKTELALLVAERLSGDYPDAQFFINLQGTDSNPRLPEEVLATCIRAFMGPDAKLPEGLDQLSKLYRSQLSDKRVLLLFDNAADGAQVRPLLPPAGSALLVTSRQAIALPGMTPVILKPLSEQEAGQLLLEIAPRAEPAAEQICALCGYLPLAVRAAGSLLAITPDLDPIDYAAQLKDERNRLERIGTEGVDNGVTASLNLSYAQLESPTARVFRLLSIFPNTFDGKAEEVICADAQRNQLRDLVRHSLVFYDSSTKRYRLHDLARLFAEAKLSDGERSVGLKHFATYYKEVLTEANVLYFQGGEALARGLALFDLEWGNIQAGHSWVAAQGVEVGEEIGRLVIAYANSGEYVLKLRQHSRERVRWLELALVAARRWKDRVGEGYALGGLGIAYADLGEIKRAIEFHEQHLSIARELGDRTGEGNALGYLGAAYSSLGNITRAIEFRQQYLTISRELGDRRGEGYALGGLGIAYADLGEIKRAIEFHEQHLSIARELGDRTGEGNALGNLGSAYYDLGEIKRAIQFYEQQLKIVREIGDRRGEGNALGGLGIARYKLGDNRHAIEFYEQQLAIVREIADRRSETTALWNMSLALDQIGQRVQAIQHAEEALKIREQMQDHRDAIIRATLATWRGVRN